MGDEDDVPGQLDDWLEDISLGSPKSIETTLQSELEDSDRESCDEYYIDNEDELKNLPTDFDHSKCKHMTNQKSIMVQVPLTKTTAAKKLIDLKSLKSSSEVHEELMQHLKEREKDGLHLTLLKDTNTKYQMNTRSKNKVTQNIVDTQQAKQKPRQETVAKKVVETEKKFRILAVERQKHKINEKVANVPKKISKLSIGTAVRPRCRQLSVSDALLSYEGLDNNETSTVNDTPEKAFGRYLPPPEYQPAIISPPERRNIVILEDERFNRNDNNTSSNNFYAAAPVPVTRQQVKKDSGNPGVYDIHNERWKATFPPRRCSTSSTISNAPPYQNFVGTPLQIQDRRRLSTPERSNRDPESGGNFRRNLVNSFNVSNSAELPVQINVNNRRSSVSSIIPHPVAMTPLKIKNHSTFVTENPHLNRVRIANIESKIRCNNHNALWKTGPYGQQLGSNDVHNYQYNNSPQLQTPEVRVYTNAQPNTNNVMATRSGTERLRQFRKKQTAPNPDASATNNSGKNNSWNYATQ